ncbi:MAG TPA: response regulator transcription factor, partial [Roseiflexaceae bacterium]|nr:response regulator transcription factor [Roseiflexaceae bacterium]
ERGMNADQNHNRPSIRILLADDHTIMRQGLRELLGRQEGLTIVAEANNGREAIELFREHRPDIVLSDIEMPLMDGITALAAIRAEYPDARGLLLTMHAREGDILRGMRAGALGYVLKDAPLNTLLEAIQTVHTGRHWVAPVVGAKLAVRMAGAELTARELDVLQQLAKGKSNQEIAAGLRMSEGTVKFHINHVLHKLGAADRTQAVLSALKRGFAYLD